MKKLVVGLSLAGALLAAGALAQDRGASGGRFGDGFGLRGPTSLSAADREAFADARIAALHAGLKLTADQEKLWPPVEEAIRGVARERLAARQARRERFASMRGREDAIDIPSGLRFMADRQAASADALRKLADAAGPLHATLDDGQKRRIAMLARPFMHAGGPMGWGGPRPQGERPMRGDFGR